MEDLTDAHSSAAVLIVDDAPFFRQQIADLLLSRGYRPVEAACGADAVSLAADPEIAAVFLDVEMPGLSGPEVLRRLKRLRPELPVVIVSVHRDFSLVREVLRDGALDYLTKPIQPEDLFSALERALRTLRGARTAAASRREAQRRLADLVLLRELGETASTVESLQRLVDRILDSIVASLQVEKASLMLVEEDGRLVIRGGRGLPPGVPESIRIPPGQGIAGHVLSSGEAVLVDNLACDRRFAPSEWASEYHTGSLLSVPLRSRERIIGVLNVNNKRSGETFSAEDQNLLLTIAHQAALAIENFRLVSSLRGQARELEEANRSLVRLHQARSRLVCNLSHELNTPLTSVLGYVDLILNYMDDLRDEALRDHLLKVQKEGQRMERIVSGMLRLFSLDSGAEEWECRPVAMAAVIREILGAHAGRCEARGLQVETSLGDPIPVLWGDPEKLFLLIEALVENAVKFNRPGGRLRVELRSALRRGAEHLYLRVHNDGEAVPPEAAPDVFEGFNQLGDLLTSKPPGVGIGLALCRLIVEGMGGEITLEEPAGEGTTFGVWLPFGACRGATNERDDQGSEGIQVCGPRGGDQKVGQA